MKHLKHLFTALLLLCCVGTAKAEEVTIDGIKYDVVTKAKQATVLAGETKYTGNIVIPETIEYNGVNYSVTSIGNRAFSGCSGLTSIEIPNSVTCIGGGAFYDCKGLTSIEIPGSVTSIGEGAFYNCTGLTSVTIPNSVTSIGEGAFYNCTGLEKVCINDLAAWCGIDFGSTDANPLYYAGNLYLNGELVTEVVIPEGVKEIKNFAFYNCTVLTSILIPNSVTSIGDCAFYYCTGLTSITIPNSVTSIGERAFWGCLRLTSITIHNSVTSIGAAAFANCTGLTSIEIPNSVTTIGKYAFEDCTGLKNVVIGDGVTSIEYNAFYGCTGLTNVVIGNGVTRIESSAFNGCTGLTSVVIGNGVTSIKSSAFNGCTGLTSVVIPNSVTSIEGFAFNGCKNLATLTIGSGVTYIGSSAFAKCENLTDVYCLATSAPSNDATAFKESYPEYMTLHVPAEAINSYKATAPWSSFGTIVTLDGDVAETPKCATPVIKYNNGKIEIDCETADAEFMTTVTNSYTGNYYSNNFELSATYNISVYATATGYENSDIVNATLCWIECECEGDDTGIINIPAKAVLVTSSYGNISISCSLDGESVAVYTTAGTLIATTTIENGAATVATGLSKGSVAIVKIGNKSIKLIVD